MERRLHDLLTGTAAGDQHLEGALEEGCTLLTQKTSKRRTMVPTDDHGRPARIGALFVELRHPARGRAVDIAEEGHARGTLALVALHRQTAHNDLAQGARLKAAEGLRRGFVSNHPSQRRVEAVSQDAMGGLEVILC